MRIWFAMLACFLVSCGKSSVEKKIVTAVSKNLNSMTSNDLLKCSWLSEAFPMANDYLLRKQNAANHKFSVSVWTEAYLSAQNGDTTFTRADFHSMSVEDMMRTHLYCLRKLRLATELAERQGYSGLSKRVPG